MEVTSAWPSSLGGTRLHLCLLWRLHWLLQSRWCQLGCEFCTTLLLLGMVPGLCQQLAAPCPAPGCTQLLEVLMAPRMYAVRCCQLQLQVSLCSHLHSKSSAFVRGHTLVAGGLGCVKPCTEC